MLMYVKSFKLKLTKNDTKLTVFIWAMFQALLRNILIILKPAVKYSQDRAEVFSY